MPRTAYDIPGLGPIRVRALQKAGLGSLKVLRSASLEQLLVVPGMSEIKARHIHAYLEQFPQEEFEKEIQVSTNSHLADSPAHFAAGGIVHTEGKPTPLLLAGSQALGLAIALLMSEPAAGYRGRLLRELSRFLNRVRSLLDGHTLKPRSEERALKLLSAVQESLMGAIAKPDLDRKGQIRLAETLADASDRLTTLLGKTVIRTNVEETDD